MEEYNYENELVEAPEVSYTIKAEEKKNNNGLEVRIAYYVGCIIGLVAMFGGLITMLTVSFGADFYTLTYKVVSAILSTIGGFTFSFFFAKILKK